MKRLAVLSLVALMSAAAGAHARVKVVASTTDLASIAEMVGGDHADVTSIAKGKSDPHYVEVLPSYMIKVQRADVYLKVGLDLDRWADQIIDGSRNGDLVVVDCSENIAPLNVPTRKVDASMGDVHPQGNPHYWLDPDNGVAVAEMVAAALITADGDNAARYRQGLERFRARLEEKKLQWARHTETLEGLEIVTYHDTWPYFSRAFGVEVVGFVEPKPGIEPTPSHTARIVELVRARDVGIIGVEPYFSRRTPDLIARETGARVVDLPPSVDGVDDADNYFSLFDAIIAALQRGQEE